jgi:hypothetical protein
MKHITTDADCVLYAAPTSRFGKWRARQHPWSYCGVCANEREIVNYSLESQSWALEHGAAGDILTLAAYDAGRADRIRVATGRGTEQLEITFPTSTITMPATSIMTKRTAERIKKAFDEYTVTGNTFINDARESLLTPDELEADRNAALFNRTEDEVEADENAHQATRDALAEVIAKSGSFPDHAPRVWDQRVADAVLAAGWRRIAD